MPSGRPGFAAMLALGLVGLLAQAGAQPGKIPITTSSEEARKLYLEGRTLAENLRGTDARKLFEQAVAKDKDFALGHLGLATAAGTTKEFVDATTRAAALSAKVSEGERHMILGLEAAMKGDPAGQERHYGELVRLFPGDERAHALAGNLYFGRQDYDRAVEHYTKATSINAAFAPAYNQLGYALRFLGKYDAAEQAFEKYIELIPKDPNPYDSYAELLMKMGRFEESIKAYEKALAQDPNFVASYVGIGSNQIYMGHPDQARATFAKVASQARTTAERRLAHFWTAAAFVHEGATDKAVAELKKGSALAEAEGDLASVSGDLTQIGDVLREAGRLDQALQMYAESVTVMDKAQVPDEFKSGARRNTLFEEGRVAVAKQDLATAKAKAAEYAKQVAVKKVPFERRQQHELDGLIALAEKRYPAAISALQQANQQDPRVLYLLATAFQGAGDATQARAFARQAAEFNGLSFNAAYVLASARKMAAV